MQRRSDLIISGNNHSYASLVKAGTVFFSTSLSYWLLSSIHWMSATSSELKKKKGEIVFDEDQASYTAHKRFIQQLKTIEAYPTSLVLDGINGFTIPEISPGDQLGYSVGTAGDFNGDNITDIVLGADNASPNGIPAAGIVYIMFGQPMGWSSNFNLTTLNGTNGFIVPGLNAGESLGSSVSTAGDVNGDGIADIMLGAPGASIVNGGTVYAGAGAVYVIFGRSSGWPASFNLTTLNGTNGFIVPGLRPGTDLGSSVSTASDFNGDGITDIMLGAAGASPGNVTGAGIVYVIFGRSVGWFPSFNLTTLNGTNGFAIPGFGSGNSLGSAVSTAGDFNGDRIADIVLGSYWASPNGSTYAGEVYVIFGRSSGWPSSFNLTTLNGTNGFRVPGITTGNRLGYSVSTAGDFNGDGITDIVLGADRASPRTAGAAYVIFGLTGSWPPSFNLTTLNGTNGFVIPGLNTNDYVGSAVNTAGDFNGDGWKDIVLGAYQASPNGDIYAGEIYVIFGRSTGWPSNFNLAALNGTNGFKVRGTNSNSYLGWSVSTAGDFNGDSWEDIVLGATTNGINGTAYVIFGSPFSTLYLERNQLTLAENQTVTLSPANIQSFYLGNQSRLNYIVSNVQAGYFHLITNPGTPIGNFTQTALNNQLVQFVHDGSINQPRYELSVSVGVWQTPWSTANINFSMGVPPVLVNYSFSVSKGASVNLTSNNLFAYDSNVYGNGNSTLVFDISNLQYGQFELLSNSGSAVMQFIQQQITRGDLKFVHNGGDFSPRASVRVTNSFSLSSQTIPIIITFYANGTNNTNALTTSGVEPDVTGAIAGGSVGGAVLLACAIGGGFWYRKRAQDARTRKHYQFADYVRKALNLKGLDNFDSEKGLRYLAVVQKLENEFSNQGGMTLSGMSDDELKVLAKQVAISARNKITSNTTLLNYSIIKPEDIDNRKISEIVQDVLRMRVGNDDTSITMQTFK